MKVFVNTSIKSVLLVVNDGDKIRIAKHSQFAKHKIPFDFCLPTLGVVHPLSSCV